MAPLFAGSRHSFCRAVQDGRGHLYLTDREPYGFVGHADNRQHLVVQGDTLFSLAGYYFVPLPRACGYWWAIADFQPTPIIDPTCDLTVGTTLHIPALRVLTDVILGTWRHTYA